jgi:hypothetical protein
MRPRPFLFPRWPSPPLQQERVKASATHIERRHIRPKTDCARLADRVCYPKFDTSFSS